MVILANFFFSHSFTVSDILSPNQSTGHVLLVAEFFLKNVVFFIHIHVCVTVEQLNGSMFFVTQKKQHLNSVNSVHLLLRSTWSQHERNGRIMLNALRFSFLWQISYYLHHANIESAFFFIISIAHPQSDNNDEMYRNHKWS